MSVTKLHSGRFRKQVYVGKDKNGKRIYESFIADTEAEVQLLAAARRVELERGLEKTKAPHMMTLGEVIDMYIEDRDGVLAPKTIREYKGYRRNYFQGLMQIKLKNLRESDVQREISRESKRLSPKSVHNAWALVRASISAAMPDKIFRVNLPQKGKKEMKIPTNAELIMLFEAVEGKRIEIPVILAATCGFRRGEIAALDLNKDVNYKTRNITINKAVSNNDKSEWIVKSPKAYSSYRTVDAPQWVIDKLKAARDNDYKNMNPAHITSGFRRICNKLGLDIRFHDLRHYYASLMLSLGVPDKYAMARMGHATPNMLKTVYQHLMADKELEISRSINDYFDNLQHAMQHEQNINEE